MTTVSSPSRGRPPLPADEKLNNHIAVSFTDAEYQRLLEASSKAVTKIQTWIRRAVASSLLQDSSVVSPREREVMALVAEGHSNRSIAKLLDITPHTVKFHICNVMEKLKLDNRAAVAAVAVRMGLA